MVHAGRRIAGRLDNHLQVLRRYEIEAAGSHPGRAFRAGLSRAGSRDLPGGPAGPVQGGVGALSIQVADGCDAQTGRTACLGKKHGGELARADDADIHGVVFALAQQTIQIHRDATCGPLPDRPDGQRRPGPCFAYREHIVQTPEASGAPLTRSAVQPPGLRLVTDPEDRSLTIPLRLGSFAKYFAPQSSCSMRT